MARRCEYVLALAAFGWISWAQQPAKLKFEVASVKPHNPEDDDDQGLRTLPGGRLVSHGFSLIVLIAFAYNLPIGRLSGGPGWIKSEQGVYDIEAVAEEGAVPRGLPGKERDARVMTMLQALLADRFKLAVHHESKEMPAYALVVSKGGHKMRPATREERECDPDAHPGCQGFNGGPEPKINARAVAITDLAKVLEIWSDRPIVDETGLEGLFDFDMPLPFPADADPNLPTLFTALDQIGLKLESRKMPVDILVIDHVERPDPD
jgi:bla regulator protein blaR1